MELKYIILTIIKILISVPSNFQVNAAALMGGYMDNVNNTRDLLNIQVESGHSFQPQHASKEQSKGENHSLPSAAAGDSEEIPDPSPLVIPGYNLPENIFNKGKPFYMEKDPVTGKIDFTNKTLSQVDDDFYDYSEEEAKPSDNIFDKSNIDRKDGSLASHRPSDINQLSPNFHDFLNLPIKYNPDKYVYPLISSSYANTKVQGNVNKYHNHKTHITKYPTYKPSHSYSSTSEDHNFEYDDVTTSTTTNTPLTTKEYKTSPKPISYPSFIDDFSDEYYGSSEKMKDQYDFQPKGSYKSTTEENAHYQTSVAPPVTTTRKIISLFEQLFGDYDETVSTTEKTRLPSLFMNLPNNKKENTENQKQDTTTTTQSSPQVPNVATGSNMEMENFYEEYDEDYYNNPKSSEMSSSSISTSTTLKTSTTTRTTTTTTTTAPTPTTTETTTTITRKPTTIYNSHSYMDSFSPITSSTTKRVEASTGPNPSAKVTSLPLGENHVTTSKIPSWSINQPATESSDYRPIIIATQNLRDQLNNERVVPKPFSVHPQYAPSSSSIHIAPDQDTVSFVVGHHQKTDGGSYSTINAEADYKTNYFQPLYGEGSYEKDDIIYKNSPDSVIFQQPQIKPHHEVSGSVVTIQTQSNSEASLSIGVPVEKLKKIPGKVMDAKLDLDSIEPDEITSGSKIVFPNEKEVSLTSPQPPLSTSNLPVAPSNKEILKLASKPMYHQLPSDLTPPKEKESKHPSRIEAPRPPWDPRPGHFYSGKLEYSRPPRPFPDVAYKRIDTLPNILPQFRPNMKAHGPVGGGMHHTHGKPHGIHRGPSNFYDNRLHREPLLERPSNRPLEFYEKLQPPPLPPKNLHGYRKIPPLQQVPQHLEQRTPMAQDRKGEEYVRKPPMGSKIILEPPKVITNLKKEDGTVETLQMLQAKQSEKKEFHQEPVNSIVQEVNKTDKPVYVVYPVNTPPIKLDVIDTNKRESVVIGTRAELPLPPSEINKEFIVDKDPLLGVVDRNDAPVLKPQTRPPVFPMKSDFPYPLERPDISGLHPVPDASNNGIGSEDISHPEIEGTFMSNNQWNTLDDNIESRIVTGNKGQNHIYAEKPIAVAYTPTEPSEPNLHNEFFNPSPAPSSNVYFVPKENEEKHEMETNQHSLSNHRIEDNANENMNVRTEQDFQAPFQASVKVDSPSQGWSVIRRSDAKHKNSEETETTTTLQATTSEFDIENFKPQLEGGFRPIYTFRSEDANTKVDERQE